MPTDLTSTLTTIAIGSLFFTVILWFVEKILVAFQQKNDKFILGVLVALQVSLVVVVLPILWLFLIFLLSIKSDS